jgi:F-type H+-transporting ATPase subunit epsilon
MFKLRIITPNKLLFEGEVESVTLPGTVGSFSVLDNHAPIISSLERGKVVYRNANCVVEYELDSGVAEVRDNTLTVCMEQL